MYFPYLVQHDGICSTLHTLFLSIWISFLFYLLTTCKTLLFNWMLCVVVYLGGDVTFCWWPAALHRWTPPDIRLHCKSGVLPKWLGPPPSGTHFWCSSIHQSLACCFWILRMSSDFIAMFAHFLIIKGPLLGFWGHSLSSNVLNSFCCM